MEATSLEASGDDRKVVGVHDSSAACQACRSVATAQMEGGDPEGAQGGPLAVDLRTSEAAAAENGGLARSACPLDRS